jgi:hypothetical protein
MNVIKVSLDVGPSSALLVSPGDKLVLSYKQPLSMAAVHSIRRQLAEALPGVETILVDDTPDVAVYKPEPPSDDQIAEWIKTHPQEFARWIAKRNRIEGRLPGQQRI